PRGAEVVQIQVLDVDLDLEGPLQVGDDLERAQRVDQAHREVVVVGADRGSGDDPEVPYQPLHQIGIRCAALVVHASLPSSIGHPTRMPGRKTYRWEGFRE